MSEYGKQFSQLSRSEMVRRAIQAMPGNKPPATDARFSDLIDRLSRAELKGDLGSSAYGLRNKASNSVALTGLPNR